MKSHLLHIAGILVGVIALNCGDCLIGSAATPGSATASLTFTVLDNYGRWIDVPDLGMAWHPSVTSEWRPYTFGHWLWTDQGWFWAGYEPFSWITDHYGYWIFDRKVGWVWVPTDEWAPARTAWVITDYHFGWAPLPPPDVGLRNPWELTASEVWTFVPVRLFAKDNVGRNRTRENALLQTPLGPSGSARRAPDVRIASERTGYPFKQIHFRLRKVVAGPDMLFRANLPPDEIRRVSVHAAEGKQMLMPVRASRVPGAAQPGRKEIIRHKSARPDSVAR